MADVGHLDHDVERLVDYVDDELAAADRAAAERQIAECDECARLVADLRALAVANREAPVLSGRPRDFRLSETEAARIRAEVVAEEPGSAPARLVLEMPNLPSAHADHDPMLIAAASDGRLEPAERVVADAWLASCDDCAALHRDLVAIASANRTLWTPARVRDYRLDEATAARLRGRDWRGFLRWIGSSRDTFTRPLAVGLTTLGIVGLLLTGSGSLLSFGSSASGGLTLSTVGGPVGAESAQGDAAAPAPSESSDRNVFTGQGEAPDVQGGDDGSGGASAAPVAAASAAAAPAASAAASAGPAAAASAAPLAQPNPSAAFVAPAAPSAAPPVASDQSRDAASAASPASSAAEAYAKDAASDGPPPLVWLSLGLLIAGVALFVIRRVARTSRA